MSGSAARPMQAGPAAATAIFFNSDRRFTRGEAYHERIGTAVRSARAAPAQAQSHSRCDNENRMSPAPGTETILIIDDELAVLSLTKLMLERHGYQVITASGAKEALHLFEVWPQIEVNLLMVDLVMPDMNGVELAQKIRALRPELPVLYFSAYSDQEQLRPVIFRTIPYIAKPFNSEQLTNCIRSILDAPQKSASKS